jgi:Tfp pilus assembly protein FimV
MAAVFELSTPSTDPVSTTERAPLPRGIAPSQPPRARLASAPSPGPSGVNAASGRRRTLAAVGAFLAVVAMAMFGWSELHAAPAGPAEVEASGDFHVVSEGDTLYSVAEGWAPDVPVASTIERIEELNGGPLTLVPGDVIALPLPVQ